MAWDGEAPPGLSNKPMGALASMHKASEERATRFDSAEIKAFGEPFVRLLMGENGLN